jgi:hypothetical protein
MCAKKPRVARLSNHPYNLILRVTPLPCRYYALILAARSMFAQSGIIQNCDDDFHLHGEDRRRRPWEQAGLRTDYFITGYRFCDKALSKRAGSDENNRAYSTTQLSRCRKRHSSASVFGHIPLSFGNISGFSFSASNG